MLTAIIVVSFLVQIYCYWKLGVGNIPYLPQMFVLLCFTSVELSFASQQPAMFLYAALSFWGFINLLKGYLRGKEKQKI